MKLTEDELKSVIDKINSNALAHVKCPVCGEDQWHLNPYLLETREFLHGDIAIKDGIVLVPYVTMSCTKCSNTLFFNAMRLGIVNQKQDNEKKEGENSHED